LDYKTRTMDVLRKHQMRGGIVCVCVCVCVWERESGRGLFEGNIPVFSWIDWLHLRMSRQLCRSTTVFQACKPYALSLC